METRRGGREADAARWHSAHVYYFDRDKDALLLDCFRPLIDELEGRGAPSFLERGWRAGPHLALRVRAGAHDFDASVRPLIEDRVSSYLEAHPSRTLLRDEDIRARHLALAARELEEGGYQPLAPDNSIRYLPYRPKADRILGPAGVELRESFLREALPLTFEIIEATRCDRPARIAVASELLLGYGHDLGGIEHGYLFCKSHAEKFIAGESSDPAELRARLKRLYEARRAELHALLEDVIARMTGRGPVAGPLGRWLELSRRYREGVLALLGERRGGGWEPPDLREVPAAWRAEGPRRELAYRRHSPYLRALFSNDELARRLGSDDRFLTHATLVGYLYALLHLVGITGLEKLTLCFLITEAVEEHFGVSGVALVQEASGRPGRG